MHIYFDEESHRYTDDNSNDYISVTTLIENFKKPFDKNYWSKVKARQLHTTQKEILHRWNTITKDSINKGNSKHDYLENSIDLFTGIDIKKKLSVKTTGKELIEIFTINHILTGNPFYEVNINKLYDQLYNRYPLIYQLINHFYLQEYKIYSEVCVFSEELQIAGKIDLFLIKGDKFVIIDWKTNKHELRFDSGYYRKDRFGNPIGWVAKKDKLLYPLRHLADSKGNLYSLQLSLYAYLAETFGLTLEKLILCHIRENGTYDDVKEYVEPHSISYLKNDVDIMVNFYNSRLRKNLGKQLTIRI